MALRADVSDTACSCRIARMIAARFPVNHSLLSLPLLAGLSFFAFAGTESAIAAFATVSTLSVRGSGNGYVAEQDLLRLADDGCPHFPSDPEDGCPADAAAQPPFPLRDKKERCRLLAVFAALGRTPCSTPGYGDALRLASARWTGRISEGDCWDRMPDRFV